MTPAQVFRKAAALDEQAAEEYKRNLTLHYMNAKLQRAKRMPSLKKMLGESIKPASFKDIVERLKAAPKHQVVE